MKKRMLTVLFAALLGMTAQAQKTNHLTVYPEFKPAIIHLADGRKLTQPLANVFLKNGALLYMSMGKVMEANMKNIVGADFDDRKYVRIDSLLTYAVDSVGKNILYRGTVIDVDAYNRQLRNNVNITNLDMLSPDMSHINEQISFSTVDINGEDDYLMPLIDHFYYLYDGKIVRVHERDLWRAIPKDKRRIFKTIVGKDDFSWTKPASLMELLKFISE